MAAKKLVIAIDCDDVLVPTAQSIINNYNATYGTSLGLEHMYTAAALETWGSEDDDEIIRRVNAFLQSDEHARIAPDPGAIAAVATLAEKHELHLVTGRADFLASLTQQMLDTYFKGCFQSVEHTNYIAPSDNHAIRRTKGEVCRNIGAQLLIDDHIDHGNSVLGENLQKVIIFGDYPWNRRDILPEGMIRCVDWQAVLKEVEKVADV